MELAEPRTEAANAPRHSFRDRVEQIAQAQAARDRDLGVSPAEQLSAGQRRWQRLHELTRRFTSDTEATVAAVAAEANESLLPHGFRLQPARRPRLAPGELVGVSYLVASSAGLEPSGTLNVKLLDTGRVRIEAEGIRLHMEVAGQDQPWLEADMAALDRADIETAVLSYLQGTMDEAPHAFAE